MLWRRRRIAADKFQPVPQLHLQSANAPRDPGPLVEDATVQVIDLTNGGPLSARIQSDRSRAAAMAERASRRRAQAEAAAELQRLRTRHWSGERLVEEGRHDAEWWEHPDADPHAVLELLPGASLEDAASARRRIAKVCHPDRDHDCDEDRSLAQRRMIAANSAYDRLRRALMHVS